METPLLKFMTCGSVDDGKSTLIGHMLYEAKLLFTDQEKALLLDSKLGSADGEKDYSLLLDGLMAEREQGITIDVAYRFFSTERRSFIVADTPGHEQYTRNMAVGASCSDLAVILTDAARGIQEQTRRHLRICAIMGIRHFVFAINKMDLVGYSKNVYLSMEKEILSLVEEFIPASVQLIPVSAKMGDNIVTLSERMPWYDGKPLLPYLEEIDVRPEPGADAGFVMPVQRVCRPGPAFRGFAGEIIMGSVRTGERIRVLPGGEEASVKEIYYLDCPVQQAQSGQPVTLTLDNEVDISRGSVLIRNAKLDLGTELDAQILWMDEENLVSGRNYYLKLSTQTVPAVIRQIRARVNVNTGKREAAEELKKNEIALCNISTGIPLVFDRFVNNKEMGAFLLIDRITNHTSACGMIQRARTGERNLTWQKEEISRADREASLNQKAMTVWFTGLSGSGKSVLANALEKRLGALGKHCMLLDGDNIRMGLNRDLGFSEEDRSENIRRIAEVARLMNDAGLIVITAFISPLSKDRRMAKGIVGLDRFREIYVSTSLEECERRDIKGLYRRAREGKIQNFTGISSPYEVPRKAHLIVDTEKEKVEDCINKILEVMSKDY